MFLGISLLGLLSFTSVPDSEQSHDNPRPSWTLKPTNSTKQFRGLSVVSRDTVWVSGTDGTALRSVDGGDTWANVSPTLTQENSTSFEFRDIHAWNTEEAVVLSIGAGNLSRIYKTRDGGQSWTPKFINQEPTAFYDCMVFENARHGLAMSDPVDGKFRLIETWNWGSNWTIVDPSGMSAALDGEFGFAASGTCLEAAAGRWYIASGGVNPGRVFRSSDAHNWKVANSSITGGAAAGVFSVRFRDSKHGIAVGGDYQSPNGSTDNAAWSHDGGASWTKATSFPGGYRSGASWVPGLDRTAIAVGTTGSDITFDGGKTWSGFDNGTFDAVGCAGTKVCWASGSKGRVARLHWQ
jgi:photosystem II stability/assembly factor-like uncharacterized protein